MQEVVVYLFFYLVSQLDRPIDRWMDGEGGRGREREMEIKIEIVSWIDR